MQHYRASRWLAIAAGVTATGGALAILLAEPLSTGHWTLNHVLLPLIVGVTIMAGHLVGSATRERRWLAGLGFAAIFVIGTALTIYSSVGAQKSGAASRAADVAAANEAFRDTRAAKARAEEALASLQADAKRLAGIRSTSEVRAAMDATKVAKWAFRDTRECTDTSALADAKMRAACQPLLDLRVEMAKAIEKADLANKIANAEAKVATLAGQLHQLGGEKVATTKAGPFADAMGVLGFDRQKVEVIVSTFEPFSYSLLFELTAIVAFGFGFAPATVSKAATLPATVANVTATVANDDSGPKPPRGGQRATVATRRVATCDAARADVIQLVQRGEPLPSQDTLAARWGCHKATASKWLARFEAEGHIARRIEGRRKAVAAA